ncbi:MAG: aspartate ammonia-lyase [Acidimicrobiaceae bacterium]|nr:aspartate ammonia-lyase [Acidimicrobiaceae bacterium]
MAPGEHRSDEQHRDEHTADRLWGTETQRAIENFPISGRPMPVSVVRWLAIIKREAARVNVELGLLDDGLAGDIVAAADAIANGEHDDQFPIDVYQTGSGTSTNMNVNEVIATLTGGVAHPNDHVNLGQSSNDTVPTAAQLAALELIEQRFVPTIGGLIDELRARAADFDDVVKPGRTHLMDAVPVVLGHEFGAYAAQLEECLERVVTAQPALGRVPLGGTAVGNGIGSHREFGDLVLRRVSDAGLLVTPLATPGDRIARQGSHDAMVAMSGALEVTAVALTKICNDLRWMASGPDTGLAEIRLPALQKGSSIMPGKVNPVIPEAVLQVAARVVGNHATMTVAGMSGTLELNVMIPVMAASLLESIELLSNGMGVLTDKCVAGIEADRDRCRALAERSLAIATALNADLGYERVEQIVKEADRTDRPVREVAREHGVEEFVLDRALDLDRIARGG